MPRLLDAAARLWRGAGRSALSVLPQLSRGWSSRARVPRLLRSFEDSLPANKLVGVSAARLRAKRRSRTLPNRVHNAVFQAMTLRALDEACGLMHSAIQDKNFRPNPTTKRLAVALLRRLMDAEKWTAAIALFLEARRRKVVTDASWFFVLLKACVDACAIEDAAMVTRHALRAVGINANEILKIAAGPLIIGGHIQAIEQALWRVEDEALAMSVLNTVALRLACLSGKRDEEDSTLVSLRNLYEWKFGPAYGANARIFSYLDSLIGEDFEQWSQRHPLAEEHSAFPSRYPTTGGAAMPDELLCRVLQHPTARGRFPWLPADQRATAIPDITSQLAGANSAELMFHQDLTSQFWGVKVGQEPHHAEDDDLAPSKSSVVFVDIDLGTQNSARMTVAIQLDETRNKNNFGNRRLADDDDDDEDDFDDDSDSDDEDDDDEEHDEDDEDDDEDDDDDISAEDMIRFLAGTRDAQFLRHDLPSDLTGSMEGVVRCNDLSEFFWSKRGRTRIGFEDVLFDNVE